VYFPLAALAIAGLVMSIDPRSFGRTCIYPPKSPRRTALPSFSPWRAGLKKAKRDSSLRRPTLSQERKRKKKSACSVRNDSGGCAERWTDGAWFDCAHHRPRAPIRKDGEVNSPLQLGMTVTGGGAVGQAEFSARDVKAA